MAEYLLYADSNNQIVFGYDEEEKYISYIILYYLRNKGSIEVALHNGNRIVGTTASREGITEITKKLKEWLVRANLTGVAHMSTIKANTIYFLTYQKNRLRRNDCIKYNSWASRNYLGYGYIQLDDGRKTDTGFVFLDLIKEDNILSTLLNADDILKYTDVVSDLSLDEVWVVSRFYKEDVYDYTYGDTAKGTFKFVEVPLDFVKLSLDDVGLGGLL